MIIEKIQEFMAEVKDLHADNIEQLKDLRNKYLSKKGIIGNLMTEFRTIPSDQ